MDASDTPMPRKRAVIGVAYRLCFDLITVLFLTRYIRKPLHFFGVAGLILLGLGGGILTYLAAGWFMGRWIGDRPLFIISVFLILVGVQLISTGLLGEMLTSLTGVALQV